MELPLAVIGGVGWQELIIILVIVLLVFGPKRLPDIADAIGKSIKKFRSATQDASDEVKRELDAARKDMERTQGPDQRPRQESPPPAGSHDDDDPDRASDAPPTRP